MKRIIALLLLLTLPCYAIAQPAPSAQLVSLRDVITRVQQAQTITASAYVLSPSSILGRALVAAAGRGAKVDLVLDGQGLAGATRDNETSATAYRNAGIRVRLSEYRLHLKALVADGATVYVSDRNWTASKSSLILQMPSTTRMQVERAILGEASSNGTFSTRKSDSLALEAALLSQRRSHTVLVETESFSENPVSKVLLARAQAGDDVTLVVAQSEYREEPSEQQLLAYYAHAGVHVFTSNSDEKIAIDGDAGFCGSSNQTAGWGDQVDWGYVFNEPTLVATLAQHVRSDAMTGTPVQ